MYSWISADYFSSSTGSSVTKCRFSPNIAQHSIVNTIGGGGLCIHARNWQEKEDEGGERERVGHSLSNTMFIFKLSYCLAHPLLRSPSHFPTYICILWNPGGWVGPSSKENLNQVVFPSLVLSHISLYPESKSCNLNHQPIWVLPSLRLGIVDVLNIQSLYVQVKKMCKTKLRVLQMSAQTHMLYILSCLVQYNT